MELYNWWRGGDVEHNYRIRNKLVEQERFIDSVTVKSAMLKDNFLLKGFMAFCVSWCRERQQIVMLKSIKKLPICI